MSAISSPTAPRCGYNDSPRNRSGGRRTPGLAHFSEGDLLRAGELGHAPLKRGCAARTILLLQIRPARRRVARLAQLRKHGDESDAKTFGRDHETDIGFRKRCEIVQEARHLLALGLTKRYPRLMSIVPTSVGVGATDVQSDAKAAYDKAMKMASMNTPETLPGLSQTPRSSSNQGTSARRSRCGSHT
jgi:hypothetical protein